MRINILSFGAARLVAAASSVLYANVIGFTTDGQLTSPSCSVEWAPGQASGPSKLTISDSATATSGDVSGNILLDHLGDPTIDVENIVYNHSGGTHGQLMSRQSS